MTIPMETLREMERLRARVEELEFELDILKSTVDTETAALMDFYNLTTNEARIIRALGHAAGAPLSRPVLVECLIREIDDLRTIDSHIKRIRRKNIGRLPIDSIYGIGYRLLPDTVRQVRDIMAGKIKPEKYRMHVLCGSDVAAGTITPQF